MIKGQLAWTFMPKKELIQNPRRRGIEDSYWLLPKITGKEAKRCLAPTSHFYGLPSQHTAPRYRRGRGGQAGWRKVLTLLASSSLFTFS